ncbi:MAG: sedoheptulose 7-phosphate cyclase [Myxococcota bacterium]
MHVTTTPSALHTPTQPASGSDYRTSDWYTNHGEVAAGVDGRSFSIKATFTCESEVRVISGVFDPANGYLAEYYRAYGRCVAVIDETVEELYGEQIREYFRVHDLPYVAKPLRAWESDKQPELVDAVLLWMRQQALARHEPLLIIGGGVLCDTAGLASAMHHRRTPYVVIGTTVIAAIDAGPSPRTCVNGMGFKNHMGAYHLPVLTIVDRSFFRTLHVAHVRHGIAEAIKMAVVDDAALFGRLVEYGPDLVHTRFATEGGDENLATVADDVILMALRSYMSHEGTNPWETHQARPHAYGHTWSPGYELASGLLHGQAVSVGMALGATLAELRGWIEPDDRSAIHQLISSCELAVDHPILDEHELIMKAQTKMIEKRGGRLWAPLPRGRIGACDYADDVSSDELRQAIDRHHALCRELPRQGAGIEMYLADLDLR